MRNFFIKRVIKYWNPLSREVLKSGWHGRVRSQLGLDDLRDLFRPMDSVSPGYKPIQTNINFKTGISSAGRLGEATAAGPAFLSPGECSAPGCDRGERPTGGRLEGSPRPGAGPTATLCGP